MKTKNVKLKNCYLSSEEFENLSIRSWQAKVNPSALSFLKKYIYENFDSQS